MSRSVRPDYETLRERQARAQESIVIAPEVCLPCSDPTATVRASDNIPLCAGHWNSWLAKYDPMFGDEPPCGAHLILEAA